MSATLWLDTAAEKTVELGGTVQLYEAFAEMAKSAGPDYLDDWPDLFGVVTQVETQEDAPPDWLADVREQAKRFLREYRGGLGGNAVAVLKALSEAGEAEPPFWIRRR